MNPTDICEVQASLMETITGNYELWPSGSPSMSPFSYPQISLPEHLRATMPNPHHLRHVHLHVGNVSLVKDWYCDVLDLPNAPTTRQ